MELQTQVKVECKQNFWNNNYETNDGNNIWVNDLQLSPLKMDGNSNPYCNFWMHSYSGSYAMDARIRLETLKSGSSSPVPNCKVNEPMYSYDFSKDVWEIWGRSELSALDSVDLIDVDEGEEEDEESWLYVSPKELALVEKTESALRWCRHILDNPSPEMEAACLKLINRLNLKLSCESRHPGLKQTGTFSFDLAMEQTSLSCTVSSNSSDHRDQDTLSDSNYRLQNITDVYDMARIQEASLRQENFYTLIHAKSVALPPWFDTSETNKPSCNIISSGRASGSESQSARTTTEKNCLSPKVTRLHQYKMLKRAQNQGSSSRSSSPMRTSLRSLQAVRSSRSLDIDDYSLDQMFHPRPGMSPVRTSSSQRSSSHSSHHLDSQEPAQPTAIKRCQRSHSLSPCRIPHPSISSVDRACTPLKNTQAVACLRNGRQLR